MKKQHQQSTLINAMPELWPQLKALRLAGMGEQLNQRNKEAIEHQVSYLEFLSILLEDELLRRQQNKFINRIKQAGFRGDKTLERFDFNFNPRINQSLIKDLANGRFVEENAPILIIGPCGTGKSHLAQALGYCMVKLRMDVLFSTQSKITQDLQTARATGNYPKVLRRLTQTRLLIIDDFALKPLKPQEEEDLHDIIAERYEQRPTIVTSNLDFSEWQEVFQNKMLAAATLDRLRHNAYEVILDGKSYRSLKQPKTDAEEISKTEQKHDLQNEDF
jgi:DNA replication protein DnaC